MFESLPFAPRKVEATEARLTRIYEAAKLGLKGDSLALASGMLPSEYRQLVQLDPIAEMAAQKGKEDAEMEMSSACTRQREKATPKRRWRSCKTSTAGWPSNLSLLMLISASQLLPLWLKPNAAL